MGFPVEPEVHTGEANMGKLWLLVGSVALLASLAPAQTGNGDEAAIRKLEADWSAAAQNKDVEKCVAVYAEDGMMFPDKAPVAKGKAQIRAVWTQLLATPGIKLSFAPTMVDVAKSKDLAYDVGTYGLTANDPTGNPVTEVGKYVVIWKKQRDKQWKAVADIFNPDK
jgi:uncharacterized protein (TIGR02246 family)